MNEQFQVLHISKAVSAPGGLSRHIERRQFISGEDGAAKCVPWVPDNAEADRTSGNVELVPRTYEDADGNVHEMNIQQAVTRRLREAGVKVQRNQNTLLMVMLSGSPETMNAMGRGKLLDWAQDSLAWAQDTFGRDNVVSASLHVDEKTPHIHLIVVPLVKGESKRTANKRRLKEEAGQKPKQYNINHDKWRLCCSEVFCAGRGANNKLKQYHDSYYERVGQKYGLSRGVEGELGCRRSHMKSIDYNRELARCGAALEATNGKLELANRKQKALYTELSGDNAKLAESIESKRLEEAIVTDELDYKIKQLAAKAKSVPIPKKNAIGIYKSDKVEEYIESRESEADLAAVKAVDYSPGKVLELYEEEKTKLEEAKKQIKKYEKLLTNPTLLRQIADDQTNKQEEEKLKEKLTRSQTLTRRR
jgi:hypothetical protein